MKLKLKQLLFSAVAASSIIGATASVVACGTPPKNNNNNNGGFPAANATQQGLWNKVVDDSIRDTQGADSIGIYASKPEATKNPQTLDVSGQGKNGTFGSAWLGFLNPASLPDVNALINNVTKQPDVVSFLNNGGVIDLKFEGALPPPQIESPITYSNISASLFSIIFTQNGKPLLKITSNKKVFYLMNIVYTDSTPPLYPNKIDPKVQTLFDTAVTNALKQPSKSGISLNQTDLSTPINYTETKSVPAGQNIYNSIFSTNQSDLDKFIKALTGNFYTSANDFINRGNVIDICFSGMIFGNAYGPGYTIDVNNISNGDPDQNGAKKMYIGLYNGDSILIGGTYSTVPVYVNYHVTTI